MGRPDRSFALAAIVFVAQFAGAASIHAQSGYTATPAYQKNLVLLNRGVAEKNWPFVVERALEVLKNEPGDPGALKVVGFAFRGLGRPQLAAAAFRASGLLGSDPEVDGVFGAVSRSLGELTVVYEHTPHMLLDNVAPRVVVQAPEQASSDAQSPALARLTREGLERFRQQVAELAQIVGTDSSATITVEGDRTVFLYRDLIVPEGGSTVEIFKDNQALGCQSVQLQATVKPRETTTVTVAWSRLRLSDLLSTDTVEVDGIALTVPADRGVGLIAGAHTIVIVRDALRATTTVEAAAGAERELTFASLQGTVHLVGLSKKDGVLFEQRPLEIEPGNSLRLPQGTYRLIVLRDGEEIDVDTTVRAGQTTETGVPARVTVTTDVPDVVLDVAGVTTGWKKINAGLVRYIDALRPVRLLASSPRHLARTYDLNVQPGGVVELHVPSTDLTVNDDWDRYYQTKSKRTWGIVLLCTGGAAAATASGLIYGWLAERKAANDAYARYQLATDFDTLNEARASASSHNTKANTFEGAGIGVAVAGALLLGGGTWMMLANPALPEPGGTRGASIVPWFDGQAGGIVVQVPAGTW